MTWKHSNNQAWCFIVMVLMEHILPFTSGMIIPRQGRRKSLPGHPCIWHGEASCQHILVHNSGPWPPTEVRTPPSETRHQKLAKESNPKSTGLQKSMFIKVQRLQHHKSHWKTCFSGHNSTPWPRRGTRMVPNESLSHNLGDTSGPRGTGVQALAR